jgi:hypothetical protein
MPEKLFGLTAKDVKHQRMVNARVMGAQGSEKPHRRRERRRAGGSGGGDIAWHAKVVQEITAADLEASPPKYGWGKVHFFKFIAPTNDIDDEPNSSQLEHELIEVDRIVYNMTPFTAPVDSQIQCKLLGPDGKRFWDVMACEGE